MNKLTEILFHEFPEANSEDVYDAEKSILAWVDEVIGEDDDMTLQINPESDEDLMITIGENANNRLRAQQRKRARS